jgi:hypothetical protein
MRKLLSHGLAAMAVACVSTISLSAPVSAAPGLGGMAGLKAATPDVTTEVRWRGGGAPIVAGLAAGIIGAGIASAAWGHPGYYGGYYPAYYAPRVAYGYGPVSYSYAYAPTPYYSYAPYGYYRSYPVYAGYPGWGRGYYGYGPRHHWRHRHWGHRHWHHRHHRHAHRHWR